MIRKTVTSTTEILAALQRLDRQGGLRPEGPPPDFFKLFAPLHAIHARSYSKVGSPPVKFEPAKELARRVVRGRLHKLQTQF